MFDLHDFILTIPTFDVPTLIVHDPGVDVSEYSQSEYEIALEEYGERMIDVIRFKVEDGKKIIDVVLEAEYEPTGMKATMTKSTTTRTLAKTSIRATTTTATKTKPSEQPPTREAILL